VKNGWCYISTVYPPPPSACIAKTKKTGSESLCFTLSVWKRVTTSNDLRCTEQHCNCISFAIPHGSVYQLGRSTTLRKRVFTEDLDTDST
jgi:hypothetical protein